MKFNFIMPFKNEVTKESVQIIRNKKESHCWGMYIGKDEFVYTEKEPNKMLEKVCNWYNDEKKRPEYR